MNLDWKEISQSEGYRSLKAAYIADLQKNHKQAQRSVLSMRNKKEFLDRFNWIISRAIHYAHHQYRSVGDVLTEWESKRSSWWFGYYQDSQQPWLVKSPHVKWKRLKTHRKEDIHRVRNAPNAASRIARIKKHYSNIAVREQKEQSKRQGKKARWPKNDYRRKTK